MFLNKLIAACAVLATLVVALAAPARGAELSSRGELLDGVAAVVNDGIVLRGTLERQVATVSERFEQQGQPLPPRNVLRQQVLERLVMQEVQLQRAQRLGIRVPDEALNETLADVARRNQIQFSELPAVLESQGVDYASYREDVRREMTLNLLRQRDVYSRIFVSPREIDQCVAKRRTTGDVADLEYDLAHILVAVPASATPEQAEERAARAQGVYERARRGEDFAQLAIAYSDSGTALEGGALGWRRANQLPSFAAAAIASLADGQVTEPIRTPSGLHLFKVIGKRTAAATMVAQVNARQILLETNAVDDDDTVRQKLIQFRERILRGEDFAAIASVNSVDEESAARGGDLGWTSPGTFPPAFEQQLERLADNEISEPFKTQFGWHIVQVLGRRTYDATDDVLRNRCVAQLREARADEETEIWMRRLRDEAFVEYRL
jgi:peptidyl-prolyl cis-trans isomerase SurA